MDLVCGDFFLEGQRDETLLGVILSFYKWTNQVKTNVCK